MPLSSAAELAVISPGHPLSHSSLSPVPESAFDDYLPGPLWELMLELQELWVSRLWPAPPPSSVVTGSKHQGGPLHLCLVPRRTLQDKALAQQKGAFSKGSGKQLSWQSFFCVWKRKCHTMKRARGGGGGGDSWGKEVDSDSALGLFIHLQTPTVGQPHQLGLKLALALVPP